MTENASNPSISSDHAMLEMTLLSAETTDTSFEDVVVESVSKGIPLEILTRLKDLWEKKQVIGDEIIYVGKIVVLKIVEFLKSHPKLTASLAISAAVYYLSHAIPYLGPVLAPVLAAIAGLASLVLTSSFDECVQMARDFFATLVSIFNAVAGRWSLS